MVKKVRQMVSASAAFAGLALGSAASADPLEAVIGLDVSNPGSFMAAMERLQQSEDVRGARVGLWVPEFAGAEPANHVVVVEYDDYADYDARTKRRLASRDWQTFLGTVDDTSKLLSSSLLIQRMAAGEGWRNHNAASVFVMTVADPVKYAQALERLVEGQGHPGSIRLMEARAGGQGATHVVIITAPDFVALNEYFDKAFASDDFRRFTGDVRGIRTMNAVSQYRRIKSWGG